MSDSPKVDKITRHAGVAGQVSYTAQVTYPGESPETITFVGSVYGGPVVMVLPSGVQTFVSRDKAERCGEFGPEWVRRFFE